MVFFSCNGCGDSVKKNQVEKHLYRCRQSTVLSCLDCNTEFHGKDYQTHVKCISEEEKYSGKDYKPKENAGKGEKKQEEWVDIFRRSIKEADVRPKLRNLLEKLSNFHNIPRKQQKFENFVKNCMMYNDSSLIKEAWGHVSKAFEATKNVDIIRNPPATNQAAKPEVPEDGDKETEKVSKRQRKEARQKQAKVEKKDARAPAEDLSTEGEEPSRKRKRKHKENGEHAGANGHDASEVCQPDGGAKRRKKNKDIETPETQEEESPPRDAQEGESCRASKPEKFRWAEIVSSLLEAANENELPLKRLKKKVVAEYSSRGYSKELSKEKVEAKLLKIIQKNPSLKLHKERVKLVLVK